MIEEAAEGVMEGVRETVEAVIETRNMIDGFVNGIKKRMKKHKGGLLDAAFEGIRLLADSALDNDGTRS